MKYRIDKNSNESAYMQLYRQLRRDITDGVYPEGVRLPSKRTLCLDCGVSVITAEHAYAILCDEGYAEARERSGYYVIYRKDGFFSSPEKIKPLAQNVRRSDGVFPFSALAKCMRKVLADRGEDIYVKSPNNGTPELRYAIADYLQRSRGINVKSYEVIIGSGAEYLYGLTVQLLGRERIFALGDPCYDKIRRVYEANGVRCEALRLGSDGVRTEELRRSSASVLHVTPFHSYPSGITASASKRREYLEWAKSRGGYIVEDDFDSEFTLLSKAEDTVFSLDTESRVIYINTFSKTVAPSFRIGYALLPPSLLSEYEKKLGFYSCTVPVFEQYVLAELINNGSFERHINRTRRARRKNSTN